MYKKTEKKIDYLLDKALCCTKSEIDLAKKLKLGNISREISLLLKEKNNVLSENMVQNIIQIIAVKEIAEIRSNFLEMLASKEYSYISKRLVKFLDINDPFFSAYVIHTLYKMDTLSYYNEILPFFTFRGNYFLCSKAKQYLKKAGTKFLIK